MCLRELFTKGQAGARGRRLSRRIVRFRVATFAADTSVGLTLRRRGLAVVQHALPIVTAAARYVQSSQTNCECRHVHVHASFNCRACIPQEAFNHAFRFSSEDLADGNFKRALGLTEHAFIGDRLASWVSHPSDRNRSNFRRGPVYRCEPVLIRSIEVRRVTTATVRQLAIAPRNEALYRPSCAPNGSICLAISGMPHSLSEHQ